MSCRRARAAILATLRRQASDAQRLLLDEHLASCERCQRERGHARLLEALREAPAPALGADARARVLHRLTREAADVSGQRHAPRRLARPALAFTAVALLLVGAGVWRANDRSGPLTELPAAPPGETLFRAPADGARELAGAHVTYRAGTTLRLHPGKRRIDLVEGEIDVQVTPGGAGHFRVGAPRFVVEVVGTRFVVRTSDVRTLHGRVRVLGLDGRELAMLGAGEAWRLPAADVPAPATGPSETVRSPAPAGTAAPAARGPVTAAPTSAASHGRTVSAASAHVRAPARSAAELLGEARRALGSGDVRRARARIDAALGASPRPRDRALAELLGADALLVESRRDAALAAYRRTAVLFGAFPEGETAAFALAQLELERGARAEARRALDDYLARYPDGRFAREARERLGALGAP